MFLDRLSAADQRVFLDLAVRLIKVDGVHDAEKALLGGLLIQMGVEQSWTSNPEPSTLSLLDQISGRAARAAALMELLGIAWADTEYGEEERAFIAQAAQRWQISRTRLALMESWVVRQIALMEEGEQLVGRD